jgi:hypothetical protein
VGAAVVGGVASSVSANKAAGAQQQASNNAIGEQQREYDQARADQAPFRTTGVSALDQIAKLYGLDTTDANGNMVKGSGKADLSGFATSPDFQFNLQQGQQAIDRSAAARGGLLSGAAVKAGTQYASGLADQEYGNYVNRLLATAGQGQTATNATQVAGTNAANNIGTAYTNAGNARASAYEQNGQTISNTANGLASNYLLYKYLNPAPAPATAGSYNYG